MSVRANVGALAGVAALAGVVALATVPAIAGASDAEPAAQLRDLSAAARAILGPDQGVYVQASDGTVLAAQAAAMPVHPASISKVPTTLALLHKLGPDYRFVTTFVAAGRIVGDRLEGDLVVESSGDPALVDENALLVTERLQALGLKRISGGVRTHGALLFDWRADADAARLRAALSGRVAPAAWDAVRALEAHGTPLSSAGAAPSPPGLTFETTISPATTLDTALDITPGTALGARRTLLVHRSEPLLALTKALNDYSNNIFNALASSAGGPNEIERIAQAAVPQSMRAEIVLHDAAGEDPANRLSPRAAVQLLRALEHEVLAEGHRLVDVLPVAGIDAGTLHDRFNAPGEAGCVVGKTGTFGDYGASALIGAVRTADRGTVYFAILNHGLAVPEARRRQDRFVRLLLQRLHAQPWSYQRDPRPAIARVEIVTPQS